MVDPEAKAVALRLLRAGYVTPSEVARLAKVSRQLVTKWCATDQIDWRVARHLWLEARWHEFHGRRLLRHNGRRRWGYGKLPSTAQEASAGVQGAEETGLPPNGDDAA